MSHSLSAEPGEHIAQVAAKACAMANQHSEPVTFDFNGIHVVVQPDSQPTDVVTSWQSDLDNAARAYRASPQGQIAQADSARRLAEAQSGHDNAMASLPEQFQDAASAITWLKAFAGPADHIGIVGVDFERVARVLERSGWVDNEMCGLPQHHYDDPSISGRWIIGQCIDMLRKGLPPHAVLMEKFAAQYLASVS